MTDISSDTTVKRVTVMPASDALAVRIGQQMPIDHCQVLPARQEVGGGRVACPEYGIFHPDAAGCVDCVGIAGGPNVAA